MSTSLLRLAVLLACCCAMASAYNIRLTIARRPARVVHSKLPFANMMAKSKKAKGGAKGGASASVQVVLHQEVKGVGKKGELVMVKPAYAENVLIRGGLGAVATPEILEQIAADDAASAEAAAAAKAAAQASAKKLTEVFGDAGCVIEKKCGPDGAIFGSVTQTDLADALKQHAGLQVEKKHIKCPSDLKNAGTGTAEITLHKEIVHTLKVVVVAA